MSRLSGFLILAALALGTTGCAGCGDESDSPQSLAFVAEASAESPAVYLKAVSLQHGLLRVDLMGRGLNDVYGLAFRLEYQSGALSLRSMEPTDFWPADGLSVAEQPAPGLLVAGISARGDAAGVSAEDRALGIVEFDVRQPTSVDFVPVHSAVVGADGSEADGVVWLGGDVRWQ